MKSRRLERATQVALISAAVAMSQAHAATLMTLDLGVEHTDNAGRSEVDPQSESIGTAGLGLDIDTQRPRLSAEVGANLDYRRYLDDTFDPEVVGGVDANLGFALIPERIVWILEDNYGQISNNRLVADSPDNRQDFNYLSTGPDITLPLGHAQLRRGVGTLVGFLLRGSRPGQPGPHGFVGARSQALRDDEPVPQWLLVADRVRRRNVRGQRNSRSLPAFRCDGRSHHAARRCRLHRGGAGQSGALGWLAGASDLLP